MLRTTILVLAALSIGVAVVLSVMHAPAFIPIYLGIEGFIVFAAVLFERHRYRPQTHAGLWRASGERFLDPTSGGPVQVEENVDTGERRYVRG